MHNYSLIPLAVALLACAPGPQHETRSVTEREIVQLGAHESPKYEYRKELILTPWQHWEEWIVGPTHNWPPSDPGGLPSDDALALVRDRWEGAGVAALRTRDSVAIRLVVFEQMPRSNRRLYAIKQISKEECMVEASYHEDRYGSGQALWYVVVRSGYGWQAISDYSIRVWAGSERPDPSRVQK